MTPTPKAGAMTANRDGPKQSRWIVEGIFE
jgi:hypothetical protein